MSDINIITNNIARPIIYWSDLSDKEKKEFDYIKEGNKDSCSFFRYLGRVYDLGQFMRVTDNKELKKWNGYVSDTHSSGVLVRYDAFEDNVIVGRYYS